MVDEIREVCEATIRGDEVQIAKHFPERHQNGDLLTRDECQDRFEAGLSASGLMPGTASQNGDTTARKPPKKKKNSQAGNPHNKWKRTQKAEAKGYLAKWKTAKAGGKTKKAFLQDYPPDERDAIAAKIKTAMKWESEAMRKESSPR